MKRINVIFGYIIWIGAFDTESKKKNSQSTKHFQEANEQRT